MNNKMYKELLKLLEYNKNPCLVFVDGQGFFSYEKLQSFIDSISLASHTIKELDTYNISNITIQKSLLDKYDDIICIYLI